MAKEDFCFTYYDGDAARDMAHMNRLERGAYTDIIISQRKFGHLSTAQLKKILGKDFDECFESIDLILTKDADGKYFIEWVDVSINKSKKNSKANKDRIEKHWKSVTEKEYLERFGKIPESGNTEIQNGINPVIPKDNLEEPLGNEYGNGSIKKEDCIAKNKSWPTMPKPEDVDELPEYHATNAIMFVKITKQTDITTAQVTGMWKVFKNQSLTGAKYYADVGDVYSHFTNWIKKQDFKKEQYSPTLQQQNPVYPKL